MGDDVRNYRRGGRSHKLQHTSEARSSYHRKRGRRCKKLFSECFKCGRTLNKRSRISSTPEGDRYAGDATKELEHKERTNTYYIHNIPRSAYPAHRVQPRRSTSRTSRADEFTMGNLRGTSGVVNKGDAEFVFTETYRRHNKPAEKRISAKLCLKSGVEGRSEKEATSKSATTDDE